MKIRLTVQRKALYQGKKACKKEVEGVVHRKDIRLNGLMQLFLEMLDDTE